MRSVSSAGGRPCSTSAAICIARPLVVSTEREKVPISVALRAASSSAGIGASASRSSSAPINATTSAADSFFVCTVARTTPPSRRSSTTARAPYDRPRLMRISWFRRDEKPPPSTVFATSAVARAVASPDGSGNATTTPACPLDPMSTTVIVLVLADAVDGGVVVSGSAGRAHPPKRRDASWRACAARTSPTRTSTALSGRKRARWNATTSLRPMPASEPGVPCVGCP
jgi:hypothetical protein